MADRKRHYLVPGFYWFLTASGEYYSEIAMRMIAKRDIFALTWLIL
jgi:hypothetical protein